MPSSSECVGLENQRCGVGLGGRGDHVSGPPCLRTGMYRGEALRHTVKAGSRPWKGGARSAESRRPETRTQAN
jgi:hypothetical protein